MNTEQQASILKAFIDRVSIADLEMMLRAKRETIQQAMNGNANSQLYADFQLQSVIIGSIATLLDRDQRGITQAIDRATVAN